MLDRERSPQAVAPSAESHKPKCRAWVGYHLYAIESLENRVLLSTTSTVPPTNNLHDLTNGPMANSGAALTNLYLGYHAAAVSGNLPTFLKTIHKTAAGNVLDISKGTVGVEVRATGNVKSLKKALAAAGMDVRATSSKSKVVSGYLPIGLLHQVAVSPEVAHVNPLLKPILFSQGIANNQAEDALSAAIARNHYNLTGAGIKVGVISNSVNRVGNGLSDSVRTGDLPRNVQVLSDGITGDTDEGRAILEEIHDIAPGAQLAFASGDGGQQAFADAISSLVNAGCNVIMDDLAYLDEPFFQPGVIDQAIAVAANRGITYLSAAGNLGDNGFLQAAQFVPGVLPITQPNGQLTPGNLIDFNSSGTVATKMTITITQPGELVFQWDDKYNGLAGTVGADLDIFLFNANGTAISYSGTNNNFQTGVPVEDIPNVAAGTYQVEIGAKNTPTGSLPSFYGFLGTFQLTTVQYTGFRSAIVGHSGRQNVISIGAVAYYDVPTPETSGALIPTETYSSTGPTIESRDVNGTRLASTLILQKPDVSATDGNNTTFLGSDISQDPDTLPNFFGTSSAVGNAAGVVALLLQINPSLNETSVLNALVSTAVPVNGQSIGSYDSSGGFGLINADAAATQLISGISPPSVTIVPVTPNPTNNAVNTIEIDFSTPVTGFDISDLSFKLNGGANLLTGAQTLTTTDNQHFFLTNLSVLDAAIGTYTLTLTAAGAGITNINGLSLVIGASTSFSKVKPNKVAAAPSNLVALGISVGSIRLSFRDNSVNENSFIVQRSNNKNFTSKVRSFTLAPNTTSFTDGNLAPATPYYYRVYANSAGGTSDFSNTASDFTFSRGEVLLDNRSTSGVTVNGNWTSSSAVPGFYGSDYLQDDNRNKGHKSVVYTPTLHAAADYFIYAQWVSTPTSATKVPFSIYSTPTQLLKTIYVNERSTGGSARVLLGKFRLHSGLLSSVRIGNKGTKGLVVADAVEFLPAASQPAPSATASAVLAAKVFSAKALTLSDLLGDA